MMFQFSIPPRCQGLALGMLIIASLMGWAPLARADTPGTVEFLVFGTRHCPSCQDVIDAYIEPLQETYPVAYRMLYFTNPEDYGLYLEYSRLYGKKCNASIMVILGDYWLCDKEAVADDLERLVAKYAASGGLAAPSLERGSLDATALARDQMREWSRALIFIAGLMDGVNPCAFSTLIFFVSYLMLLKVRKKLVLQAGLAFILATFLVYLAIGLGLFHVLRHFSGFETFSRYFFKGMGIVLWGLSGISLYDAWLARGGRVNQMILQLSPGTKQSAHRLIREKLRGTPVIVASFTIASIVALLEFTCTGQIYLPTIAYAIDLGVDSARAFGLLVLYNLGFILPLSAVFLAVWFGLSDRALAALAKRGLVWIKLGLALLFAVFGALLFY